MTDATKASRSPAPGRSAAKRGGVPNRPARPVEKEDEADVKAGEAAMREAARLRPASRPAAGKPAKRAKAGSKAPSGTPQHARAPRTGRGGKMAPPSSVSGRQPQANAAFAGLSAWLKTMNEVQQAGWQTGMSLAEHQLAATRTASGLAARQIAVAQSSASAGFRLIDVTMASAKSQLDAVQTLISAAGAQGEFARRAASKAADQMNAWTDLTVRMTDAASRTWALFGAWGAGSGRRPS